MINGTKNITCMHYSTSFRFETLIFALGQTMWMMNTSKVFSSGSILKSLRRKLYTRNRKIWQCCACPAKSVITGTFNMLTLTSLLITLDLTTPIQTHYLYLTLVTLLFSYAYESRTNQQDRTPESAWTICSLTPAFSALDPPSPELPYTPIIVPDPNTFSSQELIATFVPSYRRSLAFPLHRSFALAEACHLDVSQILLRGKRTVVRCLLEMKRILDHHEVYYVYSKVWVDDFCSWTQASARFVVSLMILS